MNILQTILCGIEIWHCLLSVKWTNLQRHEIVALLNDEGIEVSVTVNAAVDCKIVGATQCRCSPVWSKDID